jgi:hypothetical protein
MSQTSKTPIHYTEIFQFYLHTPLAIFDDVPEEQVLQDCYEMEAIPLVILKSNANSLFRKLENDFEKRGVTQKLTSVVLCVGYEKPYLA